VIKLKPDYADAYNNRGTAYQLAAQYQKALADFSVAIHLVPNDPSAYYNRAKVYRDLGQYDDAVANYDSLLYLTPNFPGGHNGRACANFAAGRFAINLGKFQPQAWPQLVGAFLAHKVSGAGSEN
jgi:tetratricopeptide (TPR) repeat protein